jgi:hypothetical protein
MNLNAVVQPLGEGLHEATLPMQALAARLLRDGTLLSGNDNDNDGTPVASSSGPYIAMVNTFLPRLSAVAIVHRRQRLRQRAALLHQRK